ncbi:MFS transporter [Rhodococcus sp. ACT016]|uniref:MFS transporter n=1 Tax=Rhodococcus sp. ACT016 TaxID=3134808 RepID=UPI003D2A6E52
MTADEPTPTPGTPFGIRFTGPLLLGSTLNPINSSMITTGLVGIGVDFDASPGTTTTLISVLYLSSAAMQPTMGRLAILFGPRRVFLAGLVILAIAGVAGAAAPAFGFLVLSRALIGIGTAAAYPTAMELVRRRAESAGTGVPSQLLGSLSIAAQVTVVLGLPIGGVLTGVLGWRALFLINVPLAVISLVLTLTGVPQDEPRGPRSGSLLVAVDALGIALFASSIIALLVFLSDLTAPAWWLMSVSILLGGALVIREQRAAMPLINTRVLSRNRGLLRTYLRQTLVALGNYTALFGVSQWMEGAASYTPSQVGLLLVPLSIVSIVVARLVSVRGWIRGPLILTGASMLATGAVMLTITHTSPTLLLVGMSMLFGIANGLSGFANQALLYIQSPADEVAVTAGLSRTFMYLGAIFSASLINLTFGHAITDAGFHSVAIVILAIGTAVVVMTVTDRGIPPQANS